MTTPVLGDHHWLYQRLASIAMTLVKGDTDDTSLALLETGNYIEAPLRNASCFENERKMINQLTIRV